MALRVGIVGLPNVGKSTLFNALTKLTVEAKNFPFTTIEPNVGIVPVPDERLDYLSEIFKPEKTIPATVEFVDIAGIIAGAAKGEGLGNKFLSHIREVDAIIHVVRAFEDPNVLHVNSAPNPVSDIDTIETELELADLEHPNSPPLMSKPTIYALNIDPNTEYKPIIDTVKAHLSKKTKSTMIVPFNAKIEDELNAFSGDEKKEMASEYNLPDIGLKQLVRTSYELLELISFFTAGPKEVRAWTTKKDSTAPEAAGKIHDDFRRGFIAAEVINFDEFKKYGSFETAKSAGKIRTEGKTYIVQDGDIVVFRFNV